MTFQKIVDTFKRWGITLKKDITDSIVEEPKNYNYFFLENGINTDTNDPKVVVYLKYMVEVRTAISIRELNKKEQRKPIWEILGVSEEEFIRDPSVGCKTLSSAYNKFGVKFHV